MPSTWTVNRIQIGDLIPHYIIDSFLNKITDSAGNKIMALGNFAGDQWTVRNPI